MCRQTDIFWVCNDSVALWVICCPRVLWLLIIFSWSQMKLLSTMWGSLNIFERVNFETDQDSEFRLYLTCRGRELLRSSLWTWNKTKYALFTLKSNIYEHAYSFVHLCDALHVTAPPDGPAAIVFPSASTQKQLGPMHCRGRKFPSSEQAGMWISAPAAMFDFIFRAVTRARSQLDGQRGGRPVVRDPSTSCPWGSTHQHSPPWHWTSWKPLLGVQLGTKTAAVPSSSSEQERSRGVRTCSRVTATCNLWKQTQTAQDKSDRLWMSAKALLDEMWACFHHCIQGRF